MMPHRNIAGWGLGLFAALVWASAVSAQPVPAPNRAAAPAVVTAAQPQAAGILPLALATGKTHVVRLPVDARDVIVSNPEVAELQLKNPRMAFVLARAVGSASVVFFDAQGNEIAHYDVRVGLDVDAARDALRTAMPREALTVTAAGRSLMLGGQASSPSAVESATRILTQFTGDPTLIINMSSARGANQVLLRVRVAEMSRQIVKELGIRGGGDVGSGPNRGFSLNTGNPIANSFGSLGGIFQFNQFDRISARLDALENSGQIKILAEPNLTAVSGEAANFLAGGEFPIPVPTDNNRVTIEYKQFGIRLTFTPVVFNDTLISLRVSTEVSQLTNQGEVILAGFRIPALTVRRAETTVEMPSGGALAIAGLLQDDISNRVNGFPILKDIPILGELFKSNNFQKNETELVVTVSPVLVRPVDAQALSVPTDGFVPAPDANRYGLGQYYRMDPMNAPEQTSQPIVIPSPAAVPPPNR